MGTYMHSYIVLLSVYSYDITAAEKMTDYILISCCTILLFFSINLLSMVLVGQSCEGFGRVLYPLVDYNYS